MERRKEKERREKRETVPCEGKPHNPINRIRKQSNTETVYETQAIHIENQC